ncbi:hypothetical protein ACG90B_15685 [Acinetobacter baumannii]|uniref:hypothetical protein n=1 Tax=Acinetobacter baumannii TaxID=470 RepID=UPI003AF7775E
MKCVIIFVVRKQVLCHYFNELSFFVVYKEFLYNFLDFSGSLFNLQDQVLLKFDSSLIPSYKNEEDFILWLADFIDRITIDTSKGDYPIKKNLANLSFIAEKLMYRH